ncbi:MAG: 30S ribosomal protein S27ae [Candidatus Aenigmarchaeota archaeon]|nr:30S ribosomal protein S27ae [Candidatus Aenigmarchaeota archaeon]
MPGEVARVSKEKKVKTKEKSKRTGRKHESLKIWEYYEVKDGSLSRKRKNCPRCGSGTFLAAHKERMYCGRCGYTEFEKKGVQPEEKHQGKPAVREEEKDAAEEQGKSGQA